MPESSFTVAFGPAGTDARTLTYDLNALAAVEQVTGQPFGEVFAALNTAVTIRRLIWAGLLRESPAITEADVGALVHLGNIRAVTEQVGAGLAALFPADAADPSPAPVAG